MLSQKFVLNILQLVDICQDIAKIISEYLHDYYIILEKEIHILDIRYQDIYGVSKKRYFHIFNYAAGVCYIFDAWQEKELTMYPEKCLHNFCESLTSDKIDFQGQTFVLNKNMLTSENNNMQFTDSNLGEIIFVSQNKKTIYYIKKLQRNIVFCKAFVVL
jgi:hypothetical protein